MNKYKLSNYNYYFEYEDYMVVFNSLSGQVIKLQGLDKELMIKKTTKIAEMNALDKKAEELIDKGMILSDDIDEKQVVQHLFKDYLRGQELFLIILPTEQCNLRCIYCYEKFQKGSMAAIVQDNILEFLDTKLSQYKALYISWFGGEPLLAMDIIEKMSGKIIELCNRKGVLYCAGITTNGTLLNEKNFKRLLKCKVIDYQITLDGGKDTHDVQRVTISGKETFTIIYNNIKMMKMSNETFTVILRTNIGVETERSIKDYIDNVCDDFKDDVRFKLHFVAIADLTGNLKATIDLCDTYQLFQYYHYARKKGIKFDYYKSLYRPVGMICYAANPNAFVIGADGNIYKCTVAFENSTNIIGKLEHGEMNLDSEKIHMWEENGFETSEKCESCKFLPLCMGKFCPLEKIVHGKEPCPPFEKYIKKYFEIF